MKSKDQQHLQEAYASITKRVVQETAHHRGMNTMNTTNTTSVYGLFLDDIDGMTLLGIYFLEGEAAAARAHYIAEQVSDFAADKQEWAQNEYEHSVVIKPLAAGQTPSARFVG